VPRVRTEAHRLIEEAMLAANVCSADFIQGSKHPGLFRVHEGPTPEKKDLLRNYLKSLGLPYTVSDEPKPSEFQHIAQATKDRPDAQQIHTMLLRSMQQAIYTPINSGHFGLAYEAYTHFTSPIRRYPDLLVHRVIKAILAHKKYQLPALPLPGEAHAKLAKRLQKNKSGAQMDDAPRIKMSPAEQQAWEAAGLHCSANERRADEASRDVEAWLKCKYMREHLGEEYSGVVTSATSFGIFVTLDNLYVEGLVHITELGGEYFRFDEARQELRGERTGIRYAIGTRVQIQVSRVDLDGRKIDFRLVNPAEEFSPRQMRDKGPGKQGSRNENGNGSARGNMAGAETSKSKSRPFNVRKAEGGKPSMRHGKVSPKGAPSKSAGSKKSSQARKSRR
jgi:ribonuclease R